MTEMSSPLSALGWPFYTRDWSPIFELDPHGEIIAINVERDVGAVPVPYLKVSESSATANGLLATSNQLGIKAALAFQSTDNDLTEPPREIRDRMLPRGASGIIPYSSGADPSEDFRRESVRCLLYVDQADRI